MPKGHRAGLTAGGKPESAVPWRNGVYAAHIAAPRHPPSDITVAERPFGGCPALVSAKLAVHSGNPGFHRYRRI